MAPPNPQGSSPDDPRQHQPRDSLSSVSTTSIVFDHIQEETEKTDAAERRRTTKTTKNREDVYAQDPLPSPHDEEEALDDAETGAFLGSAGTAIHQQRPMHRSLRKALIIIAIVFVAGWVLSLAVFLSTGQYKHASDSEHDPDATTRGSGKPITLEQLFNGQWSPKKRSLQWITGPDGQDGLLLETGAAGKDFMVVEHVRTTIGGGSAAHAVRAAAAADATPGGADADADADADAQIIPPPRTLMQNGTFNYAGRRYVPSWTKPSPDLSRVLIGVEKKSVFRHSFTAVYFILDVATQAAHPLIPSDAAARVQLATWSPASDAVAFTRDNNLYVRRLTGAGDVVQVSRDGGPEYFYGIPDWVYEEEVFSANTATWWSADGRFLAFLRTNETAVPEYTLQYFVSRPSGSMPAPGEELYPEQRRIKYPKAGAHNPVVDLLFYDVAAGGDPFAVTVDDAFPDDDRIINSIVWAGDKVLVKQTNRVSDVLKVILVDVAARNGRTVNTVDVAQIDGGWFEISHSMTFVPADPANGRPHDGYVDSVIHDGYDHLAYFAPLDAPAPRMLTSGPWEVVKAPSAVDLANNLVYFVATKESSITRHVYSVSLLLPDPSSASASAPPTPLTNTSAEAYYAASFSPGAGYALLDYQGPRVPFQKVVSTPPNTAAAGRYDAVVEDNAALADRARRHQLPLKRYGTLALAPNVSANFVERRPPHFDPSRRYPALFFQYSGPGSQQVHKQFLVDFQSYVASALGYVVITVDPRGTGFAGRAHRVPVRSRIGVLEAQDHIAAARHFAAQPYIDPARLCIWGWSYGGFQTLKTLEADAGRTFSYGMAVAPVTDWRFYDSIYAERYMRLPADNRAGYDASKVANATALGMSRRFLIMHGVADDNVHFQNSLTLLDDLDLAGVENYDVHVFPDSDHSIYFHGASRIVYDKLNNWLINAFNGEWLKIANAKPNTE